MAAVEALADRASAPDGSVRMHSLEECALPTTGYKIMSWKERIKPSNTSEATFYKAIFILVLLIGLSSTLETVLPFFRGAYLTILLLSIAYPIWQDVRLSYEVSLGKSLWLGALLTFMLTLVMVVIFFCYGLIISTIRPFLPSLLTKIVEVTLFIALIIGLYLISKSFVPFLRQSLLERTFGLVPKSSVLDKGVSPRI